MDPISFTFACSPAMDRSLEGSCELAFKGSVMQWFITMKVENESEN